MATEQKPKKMKTASAKNKGRTFQKEIAADLRALFSDRIQDEDVGWTSMGAPGVDIILSPLAQKFIPFDIEAKNVENVNIWGVLKQTWCRDKPEERPDRIPAAVLRKNRTAAVAVVPFGWIHDVYNAGSEAMGPRATLAQLPYGWSATDSLGVYLQYGTNANRSRENAMVFEWFGFNWRVHDERDFPFWKTVETELTEGVDGVLFNRRDREHVVMALVSWKLLQQMMLHHAST
jgi:hypothetical protein